MTLPPALVRRLRQTATKAAVGTQERNAAIIEAHEAGGSLREIADHVNITFTAVRRIIKKETDRAPHSR